MIYYGKIEHQVKHYSDLVFIGINNGLCSYLKDRNHSLYFFYSKLSGKRYKELLDEGFRRSGVYVYKPYCLNCLECQILRVPVKDFQMSKTQKRTWRKVYPFVNYKIEAPSFSFEKLSLYLRYIKAVHDEYWKKMYPDINEQDVIVKKLLTKEYYLLTSEEKRAVIDRFQEDYQGFLVDSCLDEGLTKELQIYYNQELIGFGIFDIVDDAWSSVYFCYDPDYRKWSIGTFSVLLEIEIAKSMGLSYYYIGYYIKDSKKMSYKNQFQPYEIKKLNDKDYQRSAQT
ncbi:MAG: arginyltransferase [Leptospiraceae bacterium]|nr:arginyltransferase [Leptospiraceae bacterium]MDW7976360.1 arginyltransferase [Leptospiraceae bacterium]